MRKVFLGCAIFFIFVSGLPAQTEEADSNYIIREEDVLSITVRDEPEFTVSGRSVRMDGKIPFPMLGEIQASGKTVKQLESEITERLKLFLKEPIVQVIVDRVWSHRVLVAGKVNKVGHYALDSPNTVLDILVRAGGPAADARTKKILIVRYVNGREVKYPFNYNDVIRGRNLRQNIMMENGDTILVP
jgi:polysaccharide export outer membrane protein